MLAFLKSRQFRLHASSVSQRTSPFACRFEVTSVPFACFLSQSEGKLLSVPFRSHVFSICLLP